LILSDDSYSEIKNFINFPNTEGGEKLWKHHREKY
jgi:hypothetical protein